MALHAEIAGKRDALAAVCDKYGVARLEIFGSAARGLDFDAGTSDFDFLVEFRPDRRLPPLKQFFGLATELEQLLGRHVDLVEARAIKNPFILAGIERSREIIYAS